MGVHIHACMHTQHVKMCTQLGAVNKPSYLSQIKSDLHKIFSVCQGWSLELIDNIHGRVQNRSYGLILSMSTLISRSVYRNVFIYTWLQFILSNYYFFQISLKCLPLNVQTCLPWWQTPWSQSRNHRKSLLNQNREGTGRSCRHFSHPGRTKPCW